MTAAGDETHSRTVEIVNKRGLHARASAEFVRLAGSFDADITVSKAGNNSEIEPVCGTSIMGLMMLAAARGSHIYIESQGNEAVDALKALENLVTAKFNED